MCTEDNCVICGVKIEPKKGLPCIYPVACSKLFCGISCRQKWQTHLITNCDSKINISKIEEEKAKKAKEEKEEKEKKAKEAEEKAKEAEEKEKKAKIREDGQLRIRLDSWHLKDKDEMIGPIGSCNHCGKKGVRTFNFSGKGHDKREKYNKICSWSCFKAANIHGDHVRKFNLAFWSQSNINQLAEEYLKYSAAYQKVLKEEKEKKEKEEKEEKEKKEKNLLKKKEQQYLANSNKEEISPFFLEF